MDYVKHKKVSMKDNPELSEKWVQGIVAADPGLLGFGDVEVKDVERVQAHGGRLDLLLYDAETTTRYEVELQLGATDESHIIRTIEYWDTERRRYPQYDHVAVIIAEEITARFFNVISLFNGFIPIVAIQMSAIKLDEASVTLVFTKVLDRMTLGSEDEDEGEPTDRAYWEQKSSPKMLKFADELLARLRGFDPDVQFKYNKYYIGLATGGIANNYVSFRPQKRKINLDLKIPRSDDVTLLLEQAGIDTLPYDTRFNNYRPFVSPQATEEQLQVIEDLARKAYDLHKQ